MRPAQEALRRRLWGLSPWQSPPALRLEHVQFAKLLHITPERKECHNGAPLQSVKTCIDDDGGSHVAELLGLML